MKFIPSLVATALLSTLSTLSTTLGLLTSPISASAIEVAQRQNNPARQTPPGVPPSPPISPTTQSEPLNRTAWHHGRTLRKGTDWVESTFRVNEKGDRLILAIQGSVELQSAQVQFDNGQVQSIQVQGQPYTTGEYLLLDFGDMRIVQSVQVVGRTDSRKSAFSVALLTPPALQ